jgi:hypothetical protein
MVLVLALGVCIRALADDFASSVKLDDSTYPASAAFEVNTALGEFYTRVRGREQLRDPTTLIDKLKRLESLDEHIRLKGAGVNDAELIAETKRNRALAWLHGWAAFSILVTDANTAPRPSLLALNAPAGRRSALDLLLSVYRQVRAGEATAGDAAPNPLRGRLSDGTDLVYLLKYKEDWRGRAPATISHRYYIPSTEDLGGKPNDGTGLNGYGLVSLWTVVNLQLDTWRDDKPPDAPLSLGTLIAWLRDLEKDERLAAFDTGGQVSRGTHLRQCAGKLQRFLSFRQECAVADKLTTRIDRLSVLRNVASPDFRKDFGRLIDAAKPITDPEGNQGYLADAAIWLRYLLLLSYMNDGPVAATDDVNGMKKVWERLNTGLPLWFETSPLRFQSPGGAFTRWNHWPCQGNVSGVVADLTAATYASLRFNVWLIAEDQEKSRFMSLTKGPSVEAYAKALGPELDELEKQGADRLKPYLPASPAGGAGDPGHYAKAPISGALDSSRLNGQWRASLEGSSTAAERDRLLADLAVVADGVDANLRLHRLIRAAYEMNDPLAVTSALKSLGGTTALSEINPYGLPRRSFQEYADALVDEANRLRKAVTAVELRNELQLRFDQAQRRSQKSEAELAAARLGLEIAARALALSDIYLRIAGLDKEIGDLGHQIAELEKKGADRNEEGRDRKRVYEEWQRNLASAEVEALVAASKQAAEMVDEAAKSLDTLKIDLQYKAAEIRARKESNGLFAIIKAVVSVVGIALSPFTGNASLAIATLANTAIDVGVKVDREGLKLSNLAEIGGQVAEGVKLAKKEWEWPKGEKALHDLRKWLKSKETDFEKLSQPVQDLFKEVKKLARDDVHKHLTAIANNLPFKYDKAKGELSLDLGSKFASFDESLQKSLRPFLDKGGIIVADVETRSKELARLLKLDDEELRKELPKALDNLVQECPKELREKFEKPHEDFKRIKDELKAEFSKLDAKAGRDFISRLAQGRIVIKVGDKVVAAEKRANAEIGKLSERVKELQENVINGKLHELAEQIRKRNESIGQRAKELMKASDDAGLLAYANQEIPHEIDAMKGDLKRLKAALDGANSKLEDKETELTIASYDADAARYFAEAGRVKLGEAKLKTLRAELGLNVQKEQRDINKLNTERERQLLSAAEIEYKISLAELKGAYAACRAYGFNPLAATPSEGLDPVGANTLRRIIYGPLDPAWAGKNLILDRMAADLLGMIQWVDLLRLSSDAPAGVSPSLARYIGFIKAVGHEDLIVAMHDRLEALFKAKAGEIADVDNATFGNIGKSIANPANPILWFDQMSAAEKDLWLRPLSESQRSEAQGVFRVRIAPKEGDYLSDYLSIGVMSMRPGLVSVAKYIDAENTSSYLILDKTVLLCEHDAQDFVATTNLKFVLIPPVRPLSDIDRLRFGGVDGRTVENGRSDLYRPPSLTIETDPTFTSIREELRHKYELYKATHLTGAIGDWTVFILDVGNPSELQKMTLRNHLRVRLVMWYLEIGH